MRHRWRGVQDALKQSFAGGSAQKVYTLRQVFCVMVSSSGVEGCAVGLRVVCVGEVGKGGGG